MRLVRYRSVEGAPTWGILDQEQWVTPFIVPFEDWAPAVTAGGRHADEILDPARRAPLDRVHRLPPVEPTAKIVCVGVNYRRHVETVGMNMPSAPIAFLKAQTAVIAHGDPIIRSPLTMALDYEVELVAVVGSPGPSLLGYTVGNDVTARDLQRGELGLDLYSGKSLDRTSPIGPWVVTTDEVDPPPVDLDMILTVNGDVRQHDRTSAMEWALDELLAYVEARTHLMCGDLVFTGTPAGVGLETGRYLQPGDVVEATIERIGTLRNTVEQGGGQPRSAAFSRGRP